MRTIDKTCSRCGEIKSYDRFYSQEKVRSKGEKYTYYQPYCKECAKKQVLQWESENPDKLKKNRKKTNDNRKDKIYQYGVISRKRGSRKEWQRNNPDKLKGYALKRKDKEHEITTDEWECCKNYFNYRCAYCDLPIEEHYIQYDGKVKLGDFHREHVDDEGANDLSNCIPSCKSCNTSKINKKFEYWYNESNINYTKDRYNKIIKWVSNDYKTYIKIPFLKAEVK